MKRILYQYKSRLFANKEKAFDIKSLIEYTSKKKYQIFEKEFKNCILLKDLQIGNVYEIRTIHSSMNNFNHMFHKLVMISDKKNLNTKISFKGYEICTLKYNNIGSNFKGELGFSTESDGLCILPTAQLLAKYEKKIKLLKLNLVK